MNPISEDDDDDKDKLKPKEIEQMYQTFKRNGSLVSELSLTKYKHLVNRNIDLIHAPTQNSTFLSSKQLRMFDKSLIEREEKTKSRLFRNQSSHNQSLCDKSDYGPKDEIVFQLDHNRSQLTKYYELLEIDRKKMQFQKSKVEKALQIRSYPTKTNKLGQLIVQQQKDDSTAKIAQEIELLFTWVKRGQSRWRPLIRESGIIVNSGQYIYLIGGLCYEHISEVAVFKYGEWSKFLNLAQGRSGASVCSYKKHIYIFQGEKQIHRRFRARECHSDIVSISEDGEQKIIQTDIEGRRASAGCTVGKYFLIFGGIIQKYTDELLLVDLQTHKIVQPIYKQSEYFKNGIAYHQVISIYSDNKYTHLYKQSENHQGIYCFGGEDSSSNLYYQLYKLSMQLKYLQWQIVEAKGLGPEGRCKHSMNLYEEMIIIFGGIGEDTRFLNDCHVFNVMLQQWCKLKFQVKAARAGHCAAIDDHRLIIFGGYNNNGYFNSKMKFIELDPLLAMKAKMTEHKSDTIDSQQNKNQRKSMRIKQQIESLQYKNLITYTPLPVLKQQTFVNGKTQTASEKALILSLKLDTEQLIKRESVSPMRRQVNRSM